MSKRKMNLIMLEKDLADFLPDTYYLLGSDEKLKRSRSLIRLFQQGRLSLGLNKKIPLLK